MGGVRGHAGRDAMLAVSKRPLPHIVARLETERLPTSLEQIARCLNSSLEHGTLKFGHVYRVMQSFKANRHGSLSKGDEVRFLGAYVFPYDNGLRLHLEVANQPGSYFTLEFQGNFPEVDGVVRMLDARNIAEYFDELGTDPVLQRRQALDEVSCLLLQTAQETQALKQAAYEAALPSYEKDVLDLIKSHGLSFSVAYNYVMGGEANQTAALDHKALRFGGAYVVINPVFGNRSGSLPAGETVYFQGASTRFGEEVTLDLESPRAGSIEIKFYPTNALAAQNCGPLNHPASYFEAKTKDPTTRSIELNSARGVLDNLRQQREAMV